MTDKLIEQIKDDRERGFQSVRSPTLPELQDRILADAEALKAAERLAMVAMNTGCATQADAEQLRAYVNAFHKARKGAKYD